MLQKFFKRIGMFDQNETLSPSQRQINYLMQYYSVSQLLPYQSYDPELEIFINKNSIGFVFVIQPLPHVDVNIVENDRLNIKNFKNSSKEYQDAEFILEENEYVCGYETEKMSKFKK